MSKVTDPNETARNLCGCALIIWTFCITCPMWLVLLFALMSANDMPTWSWVLYWVYVPCQVIGVTFASLVKLLNES